MTNPPVSINLAVFNGEKYIRHCLDSIKKQFYQDIEVNILDNASTDKTVEIIKGEYPEFKFLENNRNIGMWPGQEKLLKHSSGEYIVVLSVDVILSPDFIEQTLRVMEGDNKLGAIQGKIYQWQLTQNVPKLSKIIDTVGFQISRSRRLINIGQGDEDKPGFNEKKEIFAVEGAVPIFRRQALEDCGLETQGEKIIDPDFFWYGDDLDLTWRMRILGWKQYYYPQVIAYHDRSTTKDIKKHWYEIFSRLKKRNQIPIKKRRLDWANYRLALIKNDQNIFRDLPYILVREIMVLGYTLLFEPGVFLGFPRFFRLLPRMLRRRREIMKKARVSAREMHEWFT